nr:hypothetical protein [Pleionea sediminis]
MFLRNLKSTLLIAVMLGGALLLSLYRIDTLHDTINSEKKRAVQAELQSFRLERSLEQATLNYDKYKQRFDEQTKRVNQLSIERAALYDNLQENERALQSAFTQLQRNDKEVHDWADESVPLRIIRLYEQAHKAARDNRHQNRIRSINDPSSADSANANSKTNINNER